MARRKVRAPSAAKPAAFVSLLRKLLPVQLKADAGIAIEVLAAVRGHAAGPSPLNGYTIEHRPSEDPDVT